MKLSDVPMDSAVVVQAVALSKLKPGDIVMVGVKCKVDESGKIAPFKFNTGDSLHTGLSQALLSGEAVILKQAK